MTEHSIQVSTKFDLVEAELVAIAANVAPLLEAKAVPIARLKDAKQELAAPRIAIEKKRKELKAPLLDIGKRIDERSKELTAIIAPSEEAVSVKIQEIENAELLERHKLADGAAFLLRKYGASVPLPVLRAMNKEDLDGTVEAARKAYERVETEAAERKVYEAKIAREQAEMAIERAQLEAEHKAEREKFEFEQREFRAMQERLLKAEQEREAKAELERVAQHIAHDETTKASELEEPSSILDFEDDPEPDYDLPEPDPALVETANLWLAELELPDEDEEPDLPGAKEAEAAIDHARELKKTGGSFAASDLMLTINGNCIVKGTYVVHLIFARSRASAESRERVTAVLASKTGSLFLGSINCQDFSDDTLTAWFEFAQTAALNHVQQKSSAIGQVTALIPGYAEGPKVTPFRANWN